LIQAASNFTIPSSSQHIHSIGTTLACPKHDFLEVHTWRYFSTTKRGMVANGVIDRQYKGELRLLIVNPLPTLVSITRIKSLLVYKQFLPMKWFPLLQHRGWHSLTSRTTMNLTASLKVYTVY
jgi:hypothetical protein